MNIKYEIGLEFPSTGIRKQFLPISLGFFVYFLLVSVESFFNSKMDLLEPEKKCGLIEDYYFDSKNIKGFATWRVKINSDSGGHLIFKVGDHYIQSHINEEKMLLNARVCIYYVPKIISFDKPFISQIELDGYELLDETEVLLTYLRPMNSIEIGILLITFSCVFFSFIRIRKRDL